MFQSLFLWIFRSYMAICICILINYIGFQSLFLWIFRSYIYFYIDNAGKLSTVSILVLMDLSFLQIEDSYYNINGYVSILVLMDLSFLPYRR